MTRDLSRKDKELERMDRYAEAILEKTFYRQRWQAQDRDKLALEIHKIVKKEVALEMKKMKELG